MNKCVVFLWYSVSTKEFDYEKGTRKKINGRFERNEVSSSSLKQRKPGTGPTKVLRGKHPGDAFMLLGKLVWLSKLNVGRWSTKGPFPISSIAALVTLGCLWFCVFYPLKMEHLGGKNPLWTPAPRSVSGAKSTLGKSVDFTYSKDRQLPTEGICTTS